MRACALALVGAADCRLRRAAESDAGLPPSAAPATICGAGRRADGGWHSRTYGLLRSGQSLTPFVLNALLASSRAELPPRERWTGRSRFLKRNTNREGAVGKMDPLLYDYPNYATALTVLALRRAGRPAGAKPWRRWSRWLRTQQFTEAHGWKQRRRGLRRMGHRAAKRATLPILAMSICP